ncbi:hypothetical protein ACUNG1_10180 [Serratia sp. IR-2025]
MNSNRFECQKFIESELGCSDPALLKNFKDAFLAYSLPQGKVEELKNASKNDAKDLFYKSTLSYLEATYGIINNHSSWAIVKLYYSIFYSLRVILLLSNYAIFKSGSGDIFSLKIEENETPQKISTGSIRGDHKCTIKAFKEIFGDSEILNTNTIDDKNIFDWIMSYRELVNYRINSFTEPDFGYSVLPKLVSDPVHYDALTSNYISNQLYVYCFDPDHSIYATPLVLLNKAIEKFSDLGVHGLFNSKRFAVVSNIIESMGLQDSYIMKSVFLDAKEEEIDDGDADEDEDEDEDAGVEV